MNTPIVVPRAYYRTTSNDPAGIYTLSSYNMYIPIIAINNGTIISNSNKRLLIYDSKFLSSNYPTASYATLIEYFNVDNNYGKVLKKKSSEDNTRIISSTGQLYGEYKILDQYGKEVYNKINLMLMCIKESKLATFSNDKPTNKSDFTLVVNREFINNEKWFNAYRNVKKLYIDNLDIDVVYTNDIDSLCYNRECLFPPSFTSFAQMNEYNNSLNLALHDRQRRRKLERERRQQELEEDRRREREEWQRIEAAANTSTTVASISAGQVTVSAAASSIPTADYTFTF